MSDAVTRARELLDKATPRPWEVRNRDCGDVDVVKDHERVEHICTVGDELDLGALADAELIAAAPTLLAELTDEVETAWRAYHAVADEVERLRALTTVDDAMVERAARAVYGAAFADATGWDMANQSMRDTCRTLSDAALEAALGVES